MLGKLMLPFAAGLIALVTGCEEKALLVEVNPDGSGTITARHFANPEAGEAGPMVAAKGARSPADQAKEMEARMKGMGEFLGATFDSGSSVKNRRGWPGYQATYRFDDLNRVKLSFRSKVTSNDNGFEMTTEHDQQQAPHYAFTFSPGSPATIGITSKFKDSGNAIDLDAGGPGGEAAMMAMMKPMLVGMRESVVLKVNGQVTNTDADFVVGQGKNAFILYDAKIDLVMNNPQAQKQLEAMGKNPPTVKVDLPGLKVQNPARTVQISFQ